MLELLVAANMSNLVPAILPQALNDLTAGHDLEYTLFTHQSTLLIEGIEGLSDRKTPVLRQNSGGL
jgi:hypothetical protein